MKKSLLVYTAASALAIVSATVGMQSFTRAATPSPSTTFSGLTTIYVGAGAYDDGSVNHLGTATAIFCANVSGVTADIRVLMLNSAGEVQGSLTNTGVGHGGTATFVTHLTAPLVFEGNLATGEFAGVVNIESTQSAVFCNAIIMNAQGPVRDAVPLRLVRVNAHPGTVE
jgi:hypothetical protein